MKGIISTNLTICLSLAFITLFSTELFAMPIAGEFGVAQVKADISSAHKLIQTTKELRYTVAGKRSLAGISESDNERQKEFEQLMQDTAEVDYLALCEEV